MIDNRTFLFESNIQCEIERYIELRNMFSIKDENNLLVGKYLFRYNQI